MAKDFPYFKFFVNDWLSSPDIANMSLESQGAYINLLAQYWKAGCVGLPANHLKLSNLAKIKGDEDQVNAILAQILPVCFQEKDGVLHNRKLRSIYREAVKTSRGRSKAGKESGKARQQMFNKRQANPTYSDTDSDSDSESEKNKKDSEGGVAVEVPKIRLGHEAEDPPTVIDYAPIERLISTLPKRVQNSIMDWAGFVSNGFATQKSIEDGVKILMAIHSSLTFEPGPHDKVFEEGVDVAIKKGVKSPEYVRGCVRNGMNKWRESHAARTR